MDASSILILEDNDERIREFRAAVAQLGDSYDLRLWVDAPTMIAECTPHLSAACLISLDHDLVPQSDSAPDPGTGLEVAEFIAAQEPSCPIILHTTNHERRWSMHNALRFGGWSIEIVPPFDNAAWIQTSWLRMARTLISI